MAKTKLIKHSAYEIAMIMQRDIMAATGVSKTVK